MTIEVEAHDDNPLMVPMDDVEQYHNVSRDLVDIQRNELESCAERDDIQRRRR